MRRPHLKACTRHAVHERREPRPDLALDGIREQLLAAGPPESGDWITLLGHAGTIDDVARLRPYLTSEDASHQAALAILQILGRDARGR